VRFPTLQAPELKYDAVALRPGWPAPTVGFAVRPCCPGQSADVPGWVRSQLSGICRSLRSGPFAQANGPAITPKMPISMMLVRAA